MQRHVRVTTRDAIFYICEAISGPKFTVYFEISVFTIAPARLQKCFLFLEKNNENDFASHMNIIAKTQLFVIL